MRKIILSEQQFKFIRNLLSEQDDENYHYISPEELLKLLDWASYAPAVLKPKMFDGKSLYVTGSLDLSNKPINKLLNISYINGNLDISNTEISDVENINVKGHVFDSGSKREKIRIANEEREKMSLAQERRESGEWDLDNPDIDDEGLKAQALFQYLVSEGILDEMSEDTKEEIESLKERIEELVQQGAQLDPDSEEREELYNEIDNLQEQIDDLQNEYADVYYIIPSKYKWYGISQFEVIGERDKSYIVGDYEEVYDAAVEDQYNLIEDIGIEGLPKWLIESNIDEDQVKDEMREHYEYSIRDSPESWFDSDDFELTDEQEERKEQLENYINEMEDLKTEKEEELENTEDEDERADLEREIEEIENNIEKAQDEFDSIEPDTEPTEEMIEDKINQLVDDRDPIDWLKELGNDLSDYVDYKGVAKDIVDQDGIGTLNHYDGSYDDQTIKTIDGKRYSFVIMRVE